jgi:hypothetical protein
VNRFCREVVLPSATTELSPKPSRSLTTATTAEPPTKPSRSRVEGLAALLTRFARCGACVGRLPRERSPFDSARSSLSGRAFARDGSSGAGCPHTSPRGRRDRSTPSLRRRATPDCKRDGVPPCPRLCRGLRERSSRLLGVSRVGAPARFLDAEPAGRPVARLVRARPSVHPARAGERRPAPASGFMPRAITPAVASPLCVRGPKRAAPASTTGGWGGTRLTELTDRSAVLVESKGEPVSTRPGSGKHRSERSE